MPHAGMLDSSAFFLLFFFRSYLILFIWTCPRSTHNLVLSFQPISQYIFYRLDTEVYVRVCVYVLFRSKIVSFCIVVLVGYSSFFLHSPNSRIKCIPFTNSLRKKIRTFILITKHVRTQYNTVKPKATNG